MKLSDYIISFLRREGISCIFEVCGGSITHILDSLYGKKDIKAVSMHHEQTAAFAAEGYSRTSENLGVAMATSGPGATNLITGIGSAFFDSIPSLFITGQVNTYEFKFDKRVRQLGFQETDIAKIVKPIVKEAHLIRKPDRIRYYLERSVHIARSGRPGPVLLDIPMNVQRAEINPSRLKAFALKKISSPRLSKKAVCKVAALIRSSNRPVILVGGGVRLSGAQDELLKLLDATGIPIVSSLMGLDICPHDNSSFMGMIGAYGNRYANLAAANADMILALGTRLDTRQTGTTPSTFAREAKIVHVDIDHNEIGHKIKPAIGVAADIKQFLRALNGRLEGYDRTQIAPWIKAVKVYKKKYLSFKIPSDGRILPNLFMSKLSDRLPDNAIICVDVGQHQMWAAQSLKIKSGQRFITEGGMGSMGSSLALAIGASFAKPDKTVVVITGDGGFQVNIQELETVKHHKLNIKIILLNNNGYGMIRQFQKQYFNSRFQSTVIGYSQPDFQAVVSAYKIPAIKISRDSQIKKALNSFFKKSGPSFLEIYIGKDELVLPKLSVNKPIEEQDPQLPPKELKTNMFIKLLSEKDR